MLRKSACALVVMAVAAGAAAADEFFAEITRVDGNRLTYQKYEKGQKVGDAVTAEIAPSTTVAEYQRGTGAKKVVAGKAIEGGLKNAMFPTAPGDKALTAVITTTEDPKAVKQILVVPRRK